MLPFTPITEELLPRSWIEEEYPILAQVHLESPCPLLPPLQAYTRPDPPLSEGWKGYIIMAHAIIDSEAAWAEALQLTAYDDGNTKSNTLYWIGTREGAADCPDCTTPGPTEPPPPTDHPTPTTTGGPLPGCDCHPGGVTTDPR